MLTGKRQEFRNALGTVADVSGFATRPKSNNPGDAWPVFAGMTRDEGTPGFIATWHVFVILPVDQAAADAWIDDHIDDLHDKLQPIAYIDSFAPVQLADGPRALSIELRCEP